MGGRPYRIASGNTTLREEDGRIAVEKGVGGAESHHSLAPGRGCRESTESMKLKSRALPIIAAALVAVPAIALGASLDGSKAYDDPAGDSVPAPDTTRTVVKNDNAGTLAFSIKIPNRPALRRDMVIVVFLDTDPKRGDKDGVDWVLQVTSGLPIMFGWNGSDFVTAQRQSSVGYAYDNSTALLLVNRQELGNPATVRFAMIVGSGASEDIDGNAVYTNLRADAAPDQGFYAYTLATLCVLASFYGIVFSLGSLVQKNFKDLGNTGLMTVMLMARPGEIACTCHERLSLRHFSRHSSSVDLPQMPKQLGGQFESRSLMSRALSCRGYP
jgi:hypothetical protein